MKIYLIRYVQQYKNITFGYNFYNLSAIKTKLRSNRRASQSNKTFIFLESCLPQTPEFTQNQFEPRIQIRLKIALRPRWYSVGNLSMCVSLREMKGDLSVAYSGSCFQPFILFHKLPKKKASTAFKKSKDILWTSPQTNNRIVNHSLFTMVFFCSVASKMPC